MTGPLYTVRAATTTDADAIVRVLADAFYDDPPLIWIIPDDEERLRLAPAFFRPFVDLVLADGLAHVTDDLSGAALWLDVDIDAPAGEGEADLHATFVKTLGLENAERFAVMDKLFAASHPGHQSHAYLLFVGVTPPARGTGVGSALLSHRLAELDAAGRPAYLEASSARNVPLYARHGFAPIGADVTLPNGPALRPMWRQHAR